MNEPVPILDEASLTIVRAHVREVATENGIAASVLDRALLVATELGRNQLRHARAGFVNVVQVLRDGRAGLEITATDGGEGMADIASVLDGTPRAEGTLGVGVGSIRRLSTEVDFAVRVGEGLEVTARLFPDGVARRREIGIYGRPHPEERVCGDAAAFVRAGDVLVVGVCDGLGHGTPARDAAVTAMNAFRHHATESLTGIVSACATALTGTRGVVMAIARFDEAASTFEATSIGNVEVGLVRPRAVRRFGGTSAVLGRPPVPKARAEGTTLAEDEVLVVATDGISTKLSIERDLLLLRAHPIVIAQRIIERFARDNDDALVLVAR